MICKSEERRGVRRHHLGEAEEPNSIAQRLRFGRQNQGTAERVADYSMFSYKILNPCGTQRRTKRSSRSSSLESKSKSKSVSDAFKVLWRVTRIIDESFPGKRKVQLVKPLPRDVHRTSPEIEEFNRGRRSLEETHSHRQSIQLEISNLLSGIQFQNGAHTSQVIGLTWKKLRFQRKCLFREILIVANWGLHLFLRFLV